MIVPVPALLRLSKRRDGLPRAMAQLPVRLQENSLVGACVVDGPCFRQLPRYGLSKLGACVAGKRRTGVKIAGSHWLGGSTKMLTASRSILLTITGVVYAHSND